MPDPRDLFNSQTAPSVRSAATVTTPTPLTATRVAALASGDPAAVEREIATRPVAVQTFATTFEEVRKLSLEHVRRSRAEPGCISHAVHVDCENPLRLVFFEQWADRAALLAHFAVPASREFVRSLRSLAAAATTIELYDATQLEKL